MQSENDKNIPKLGDNSKNTVISVWVLAREKTQLQEITSGETFAINDFHELDANSTRTISQPF